MPRRGTCGRVERSPASSVVEWRGFIRSGMAWLRAALGAWPRIRSLSECHPWRTLRRSQGGFVASLYAYAVSRKRCVVRLNLLTIGSANISVGRARKASKCDGDVAAASMIQDLRAETALALAMSAHHGIRSRDAELCPIAASRTSRDRPEPRSANATLHAHTAPRRRTDRHAVAIHA